MIRKLADNAIASLSQAISLQPDLANAYLNRGTIYLNLGQSALGLADMESAIRHDPSLIDAHLNIAMEMHAQNRRAESAAAYPGTLALDIAGLPANFKPLFAGGRSAFVPAGDQVVAHGGVSVEELIVPFVRVSNVNGVG